MSCTLDVMTVEQLLSTEDCACDSHTVADNRDGCQHCGAEADELCAPDCPVGELDNRQAAGDMLTAHESDLVWGRIP